MDFDSLADGKKSTKDQILIHKSSEIDEKRNYKNFEFNHFFCHEYLR